VIEERADVALAPGGGEGSARWYTDSVPRLPRPSRRTILTASLLLLAGAVVNVAVACITANVSRTRVAEYSGMSVAATDYGFRVVHRWRHPLFDRISVSADNPGHWDDWWSDTAAPPVSPLPSWAGRAPDRSVDVINENSTRTRAFGLPLRALSAEAYLSRSRPYPTHGVLVLVKRPDSRRLAFETRDVIFIPTVVHPPGFAINTLFYAAIVGAILACR
jgi:hypothetical protein